MNLKLQKLSKMSMAFLMALFSVWGWGQSPVTITTSGNGSWTVPANVYNVKVECWGGGGAGGSAVSSSTGSRAAAGGGAGGSYAKSNNIAVTPGSTISYSVGAGGTASSTIGAVGNGGDTWFSSNTTLLAKGGAGAASVTGVSSLTNGVGGLGTTAGSIGDDIYKGGDGANGLAASGTSGYSGGGGSSSGREVNGNNASGTSGGTAPTGGFAGATGVVAGNPGNAPSGTSFGAAGSGAYAAASTSQRLGGSGMRGRIIITYTIGAPTAAFTATENYNTFTYVLGNGPSAAQSITASGANLNGTQVTVTASSDFEISLDGITFANSQIVAYSNNAFANQNIYARLKNGLTGGNHSGNITISGGGATDIVKVVNGSITYPVSAISNNTSFGTVSILNNVITGVPAVGYTYANPAYTVVNGTATVSQNGNEFTVTPSDATQVQINFAAQPTYTLSLMNDGAAYSNANFPFVTYQGNTINLPTLANCGNYTFIGWDTNSTPTATPTYTGGAVYNTTASNVTLYAVYSEITGTPEQWTKVSSLTDIVAGTYVIVNGGYFLPNANTGSAVAPEQITLASKNVTVSNGSLVGTIATDMQWDFTGTNSAMAITSVANSADKLYNISNNNGVRVHTTNASWAFETYLTGFAMSHNSRYCAVYTSGNDWRSYTTRNAANYNTNDGILDIYKKTGGSITTYTTTPNCASTTTWTGSTWSNGTPTSILNAFVSSNYSGNGFTAQNLTVNPTITLTINNGQTVTAGNIINNGNIIVNDGGNFVQTVGGTYTAGTGASFVANRNSTSPATKYVFWSSPVADQNLYKAYTNVPSGTAPAYVMMYDTATNLYPNVGNDDANFTSNAGKGYSVKVPATNVSVSFGGSAKIPNNGNVNVALSTASFGYNLIGNPYPSNIDLTAFYNANTSSIAPTMWLWDNTTGNVTTQTGNTAVNVGYATFNGPSGTWTEAPSTTGYNNATLNGIGAFAKIGQGFIVKAISAGSATFTNAIRASNTAVTLNKNLNNTEGKFWVKLTTSYGNNVTQAITYSQGASDAYDLYDSKAMGMGSDAFYSLAGTEKLVIQGRAPFNVNDVVQLGNKHFETGNFTISLSHKEGLFTNGQEIYLHDKQSGTYTNLQNGTYNFSANAGDFTNRFEIVYKLNVLSTNETEKGVFEVYRDGEDFVVRNHKNIQSVEVFDAAGRKIQQITSNSKSVMVKIQAKGMYILKAVSEGKEYTQKIIK